LIGPTHIDQALMTFYGREESTIEIALFGVFAGIAVILLVPGIIFAKRFFRFGYFVWLTPIQCAIIAAENLLLSQGSHVESNSGLAYFGAGIQALIAPFFLIICFDMVYIVHKNRSVNFFCISFDEGHRKRVEPYSWIMRNLMRIIAGCLIFVGVLVNYDLIGNDRDAGVSGFINWSTDDATEVTLSLIPGTILAIFNLVISFRLWLYGTQRALVIHATIWNEWVLLFIGSLGQLIGLVSPTSIYPATSNAGEVFLLMCIIFIQYTIKKDFFLSKNFTLFLDAYDKIATVKVPLQRRNPSQEIIDEESSVVSRGSIPPPQRPKRKKPESAPPKRPSKALSFDELEQSAQGTEANLEL